MVSSTPSQQYINIITILLCVLIPLVPSKSKDKTSIQVRDFFVKDFNLDGFLKSKSFDQLKTIKNYNQTEFRFYVASPRYSICRKFTKKLNLRFGIKSKTFYRKEYLNSVSVEII
jgi:hypothetical protein